MKPLATKCLWIAIFTVACGAGSDVLSDGPVARLLIGDGDPIVVHHRTAVSLPVRAFAADGREVAVPPVAIAWRGGDALTITADSLLTCPARGESTVELTAGDAVVEAAVRCEPVTAVHLAGPLDLLLSDSSRDLDAFVVGTDGQRVLEVRGTTEVSRRGPIPVIRVDAGRVVPLAPGHSSLTLTVGAEETFVSVFVYEPVAALDDLRPEQHHVAIPITLTPGESRSWAVPVGVWSINIHPHVELPEGAAIEIEEMNCDFPASSNAGLLCLTKPGGVIRMSYAAPPSLPPLQTNLVFRRTNQAGASAYCESLAEKDPAAAAPCLRALRF